MCVCVTYLASFPVGRTRNTKINWTGHISRALHRTVCSIFALANLNFVDFCFISASANCAQYELTDSESEPPSPIKMSNGHLKQQQHDGSSGNGSDYFAPQHTLLYDFTAVYPKTISFDEGEYFILHQTSARQRNWWQVVSMKGNIGFVPSNYVMKLKVNAADCRLMGKIWRARALPGSRGSLTHTHTHTHTYRHKTHCTEEMVGVVGYGHHYGHDLSIPGTPRCENASRGTVGSMFAKSPIEISIAGDGRSVLLINTPARWHTASNHKQACTPSSSPCACRTVKA